MLTLIIIIVGLYITVDWIKHPGKYDNGSSWESFKRRYDNR